MIKTNLLNVLISAYACEPGKGSEPGVGWYLVKELSKHHRLTVITRANNRAAIKDSGEDWIDRVNWIYYDPPKWATFWKQGGRGVQAFYILWQIGVARLAKRLHRTGKFDIAHHLTFGRYWIPSGMASLGVPFVFGPVGGGERCPSGFAGHQHARARVAEFAKHFVQRTVAWLPSCRRLYRSASWTFAATPQTGEKLRDLGVTELSVLPQSGIDRDFVNDHAHLRAERGHNGTLHLVTACRLIHWKAVDLAIAAVALVSDEIDVRLEILQDGPERDRLISLAAELGVESRVYFLGKLASIESVYAKIAECDALVHPALHEAFGQACLEALALGVPVLCLDWAGPGIIVDESSGFKVPPGSREETILRLANAMRRLAARSGLPNAEACRERALRAFSWPRIAGEIGECYQRISRGRGMRNVTGGGRAREDTGEDAGFRQPSESASCGCSSGCDIAAEIAVIPRKNSKG